MDNKQKIIEILDKLYDGQTVWDVRPIADEIDALYHRDCGKCTNKRSGWCVDCIYGNSDKLDYYEEADK